MTEAPSTSRFSQMLIGICCSALGACGVAQEPARVELAVFADSSGLLPTQSDLGYTVELTEARMVAERLAFTIAGEVHATVWRQLSDALIPPVWAHPGHFQAGEVTGELPNRVVLDWLGDAPAEVGTATLLAGVYQGANVICAQAGAGDGMAPSDPMIGHTALLGGRATRNGRSIEFLAMLDAPEAREIVGVPFQLSVDEGTQARLGVRLLLSDPFEGDTLFDGVDFAALDTDADGHVVIKPTDTSSPQLDAFHRLRRALLTHDHFDVVPSPLPATP